MILDPSVPSQEYIEDCEVCCRPLSVHVVFDEETVDGPGILSFSVTDDS